MPEEPDKQAPRHKGMRWGRAGLIAGLAVILVAAGWYGWMTLMATSCSVDVGDPKSGPLRASRRGQFPGPGDRPAFLVLFHDTKSRGLDCFIESIWESVVPDQGPGSTISLGSLSLTLERGNTEEVIGRNLAQFARQAGSGRWQKLGTGYVIHLGTGSEVPDAAEFRRGERPLPRAMLLSPDLDKSCRLLSEFLGLPMVITAKGAVKTVIKEDLLKEYGRQSEQLHFRTEAPASVDEFVARLAAFHGCAMKRRADGMSIDDFSEPELQARIARLVAAYDFNTGLYTLPPAAGPLMLKYLQAADENTIQFALYTLMRMRHPAGQSAVITMLKARPELSASTRFLAGEYLAALGDEAALPCLERSIPRAEGHPRIRCREALLVAGWVRTPAGADCQARILRGQLTGPRFTMGRVNIEKLPQGVSAKEARGLLRLALGCADCFFSPISTRITHAHLTLAPDGKSARCSIVAGHRGWRELFDVEFIQVSGHWFITSAEETGDALVCE